MTANDIELTRRMGTAMEPAMECLVDCFVRCVPATMTSQQKGHCVIVGKVRTYVNKKVEAEKLKYYQRFFPYRLAERPEKETLFARLYFYWPPGVIRGRTMGPDDVVLKTTKPDVDNAGKLFLDAVQPLFFEDDCRIAGLEIQKAWCKTPGVYFGLWRCSQ